MSDRPSTPDTMMNIAVVLSWRSTCPRGRAGCVITDRNGFILSTGYNGSPAGTSHCNDVGCLIDGNHCVRTVHAETNAVVTAARNGVSLNCATAYCTMRPCVRCTGVLIQAGVTKIIYKDEYASDDKRMAMDLADEACILVKNIEES